MKGVLYRGAARGTKPVLLRWTKKPFGGYNEQKTPPGMLWRGLGMLLLVAGIERGCDAAGR